jgi:DNA-binding transcriptional MerR regulator
MSMAESNPMPIGTSDHGGDEARNHISIGEVLSLLQDEFPDVTISKIRFLESQGLLNPERTPSGYRKFYEADVEQLRWVLRQQRENFLPLKVIKDRLAAGRLDASPDESGILALGPTDDDAASSTTAGGANRQAAVAGGGASPSTPKEDASGEAATVETPGNVKAPARRDVPVAGGNPRPDRSGGGGSRQQPAPTTGGRDTGPEANESRGVGVRGTDERGDSGSDPLGLSAGDSGVSMTASELCGAAGLTLRQLAELESFGLVRARPGSPDPVYDEDALLAARLASALGEHGVEPRHLRMFRLQADREAALYEQLTVPRLMAHRAEARDEALEDLARIVALGDDLRAALLRHALRDNLRQR